MSSILKGLASVFGGYSLSNVLSDEDIRKALSVLCAVPARDKKFTGPARIPSTNFTHITETLKHFEARERKSGWAYRPRIFTVLHQIGRPDLLQSFIDQGLNDFHLPLNLHDLPLELDDLRQSFLRFQEHVQTHAKEIELGVKGGHVSLANGDEHFIVRRYFGSGGFGDVYEVWSRLSHRYFARKRFRRGNPRDAHEKFRTFEREVSALKRLSHRHLVQIIGSYTDRSYFAFLMSPVAEENLKSYLNHATQQQLPELRSFFGCLANAIAYLHSKQIHHMDIKLENILIKNGELYVADFGSAHDWSSMDKSTTWNAAPRTERYIPPELAKDPYAPKNSATDIWSLGIVFLEMVTVIRGFTVGAFRSYMLKHGTGHQFVHANPSGMASWTEELQKRGEGPDSDNEPLLWIHDMTRPHPLDRPTAKILTSLILNSPSAEQFRRICCADMDDSWEDLDSYDTTNGTDSHPVVDFDEDSIFIEQLLSAQSSFAPELPQNEARTQSVQAWLNHGDSLLPEFNGAKSQDLLVEDSGLPFELDEDEDEVTQIASVSNSLFEHIPLRLRSFEFLDQEPKPPGPMQEWGDYENDEIPFDVDSDGCSSKYSEATARPFELLEDIPEDVEDDPDVLATSTVVDPTISIAQSQRIPKTSSEASENISKLIEEELTIAVPNERLSSSSKIDQPGSTTKLTGYDSTKIPQAVLVPVVPIPNVDQDSNLKDLSTTSSDDQEEIISKVDKHSTPSPRQYSSWERDTARTEDRTGLDLNLTDESPKGPRSPQPINSPQAETSTTHPKESKDSKSQGPSKLTLNNLNILNSHSEEPSPAVPQPEKSKKNKKGLKAKRLTISASKYIQDIYEAESSAATSVVSERTRAKLEGSLSVTKWQDKSYNLVGHYAKQGKAAAVRILLEKKCNPGTIENPRPGPVLSAVRGGTPRHTKCLRVLIEFGANINIRQTGTGKTPLHFAIEHQYFKGYGNLVFELLSNGAEPNSKDHSGEYPLLKILYGGYEALERYRRDALALLLYYDADVNITPPGTLNKPIHLAVRRKDPWAVGMLLEKGALVNEPNGAGITPLALAATEWNAKMTDDQKEVARQLLHRGAPVDQKIGSSESTVLHLAVSYGQIDMIMTFVGLYGADPNQKDKAGSTAFDLAKLAMENSKVDAQTYQEMITWLEAKY